MKSIDPKIRNLVERLVALKRLFGELDVRTFDEPLRAQLGTLVEQKQSLLNEWSRQFDISAEDLLTMEENTARETDEARIKLNDLLIQGTEQELVDFTIAREQNLYKMYVPLTTDHQFEDYMHAMLHSQKDDVKRLIKEFEAIRESVAEETNS